MMKRERIAVVVEDVEAARAALRWALHNILRYGDILTLLHVVYSTAPAPGRTKTKRTLRREGFKLALSFRDLCRAFPYIDVEIVVTDGDDEARRIAAVVDEIGASTLVLGLHDRSFLYKMIGGKSRALLGCKVVAVKEAKESSTSAAAVSVSDMDFWEIHLPSSLSFPPPRKVPYRMSRSKSYHMENLPAKEDNMTQQRMNQHTDGHTHTPHLISFQFTSKDYIRSYQCSLKTNHYCDASSGLIDGDCAEVCETGEGGHLTFNLM